MVTYVWRDGKFYEKGTVPSKESVRNKHMVISDIKPYKSPLGNWEVGGRMQRREELKRHGCREVDPSERPKGFVNDRFAKKYGLNVSPEAKETGY